MGVYEGVEKLNGKEVPTSVSNTGLGIDTALDAKMTLLRNKRLPLILLAVLSALIAWLGISFFADARKMINGDATAAFFCDVASFAATNNKCLPKDWLEFNNWYETQHKSRWRHSSIEQVFSLQWCMNCSSLSSSDRVLRVVDKTKQKNEGTWNDLLIEDLYRFGASDVDWKKGK